MTPTGAVTPAAVPPAAPATTLASAPTVDATPVAADTQPAAGRRSWTHFVARYAAVTAFLGVHVAAVVTAFLVPVTAVGLALCAVFYAIRVFALTAGFHRYFAHRGYKTSRWFQFVIAWAGTSALQRGPIWWAGHHRTHHRHSDTDLDPHSPITKSVWWSHMGWVVSTDYADKDVWAEMRDWKKYPELAWLERHDILPGVLLAVFCYLVGGWSGLVWGFLVSTALVYQVTFMVNSVCHLFGRRRFATKDESRNNWLVALLTFGEGWHNNHHHYPSAARQGFRWWELDISYLTLKVLSWFGIVWDLRQPTPRALSAKLAKTPEPATV